VRSEDNRSEQRYLYADYSPLEEGKNVVKMLEDFVSLTGKIIQLHTNNEKLALALASADSIGKDFTHTLDLIKAKTQDALDIFHNKYPDVLDSALHTSSTALLNEGCKTIFNVLTNAEVGFDEQFGKYTDEVKSKVNGNNASITNLVESWLARDSDKLPAALLDHFSTEVSVKVESSNLKAYSAHRKTSNTPQAERAHGKLEGHGMMQVSYLFRIDTSRLKFWASPRKLSELGVEGLFLPVGMNPKISEKFKQAFRFGSKKHDGELAKEPQFVKVDDYYISAARFNGKDSLSVQIIRDLSKPNSDIFEITFDIRHLSISDLSIKHPGLGNLPKLDYMPEKNTAMPLSSSATADLFRIDAIARAADLSKIWYFATRVLEELNILHSPETIAVCGQLESLKANDGDILKPHDTNKVEYLRLFDFLDFIATSFAPYVISLKEKTPLGGELILRQEVEKGKRREYSVKSDDLKSRLPETHTCGKRVAKSLNL